MYPLVLFPHRFRSSFVSLRRLLSTGLALATLLALPGPGQAAQPISKDVRLNRVIEMLEQKQVPLGIFSSNVSPRTGAAVAGSKLDFVIIDLEHSPYDLSRLEGYLFGMIDKRQILQKGNLQPNVVPIVRVPSAGREQLLFVIKQVLDLGVFGLLVPHVDTAEDALAAVRASRFPQLRTAPDREPAGARGIGYGWPARVWGLSGGEYAERADLWPLDPRGEILLWLMIETHASVENIRAIARTPGVSGLFIGPSDLAFSMGLPLGHPEVEVAIQKVLKVAKEEGIPCGTLTGGSGVQKRLDEGFDFLAVGGDGGLSGGVQEALRVGEAFRKKQRNSR